MYFASHVLPRGNLFMGEILKRTLFVKGSEEAKAHMASIRAKSPAGKFEKGSPEAKAYMEKIRSMNRPSGGKKKSSARFVKGSEEAKMHMANIRERSAAGKLVKGSPEAKAFMSNLRAMRNPGGKADAKASNLWSDMTEVDRDGKVFKMKGAWHPDSNPSGTTATLLMLVRGMGDANPVQRLGDAMIVVLTGKVKVQFYRSFGEDMIKHGKAVMVEEGQFVDVVAERPHTVHAVKKTDLVVIQEGAGEVKEA